MQTGFRFKNKHSTEIGAVVKTKARTLLPEVKSYSFSVPLADGEYDMTEANPFNRPFYNNRVFEVIIQIAGDSLAELERKAAKTAIWLNGSGTLIFDDSALVKWKARVISEVAYTPEKRGKLAKLSAVFRASAIGEASFNTGYGITLSDALCLDSDIPLDMTGYFEKSLNQGENTIEFINMGDFYVRPVLRFDFGQSITLTYGDTKIMLEDLSGGAVIDFEKCVIRDLEGSSIMNKMQGNFFELPPGVSELSIYVDVPCVLNIEYSPKTIYDFDFSDIDWGQGNA